MGAVNKANGRQSSRNKAKYAAQYAVTYKNKKHAINEHIMGLRQAAMMTNDDEKLARIDAQIRDCERAITELKLKK